METPGREFPPSWTSAYELLRGEGEGELSSGTVIGSLQPGQLQVRTDYKSQAWVFEHFVLKNHVPVFDKTTEEGARFRIYRIGSIEVRTIQEHAAKEAIRAIFSIKAVNQESSTPCQRADNAEKLLKVTEYVDRALESTAKDLSKVNRRFYTVAETANGNVIVTEKTREGRLTWIENPKDLEDRNSLAKTICFEDCTQTNTTVLDLKRYYE